MSRSALDHNLGRAIMGQAPTPAQQPDVDDDEDAESEVKKGNSLTLWGNAQTMNLNHIVISNVLASTYFKNHLFKLKTYHEVIDEIYYNVDHMEPWEKGSRKTHGQVGMCGGVRGVGAGGIVSSAYCLLFKLFTLKLTEKQLLGLVNYYEAPYIRGLGFMFIRYCIDPKLYWYWFEPYLEDDEEIDPKAGAGSPMTIGMLIRSFLLRLDWYGTLFPRIPVPVHKDLEKKLKERNLCNDRERYAGENATDEKAREDAVETKRKERENERNDEKDVEKRKEDDKKPRERNDERETGKHKEEDKRSSASVDGKRADVNRSSPSRKDSRDGERDRRRDSSRDRDRKPDSNRDRDRKYDSNRDGDRKPDSNRDKKPDSSRDRDRKRDSSRDRNRDSNRDSNKDRDYNKDRDSTRDRDRRPRSRSPKRVDRSRDR